MFSEDREFVMRGKATGINYYADFLRLQDIAIRLWKYDEFRTEVVAEWNRVVFGDDNINGYDGPKGEDESDYDEIMDDLEGRERELDENGNDHFI